MGTEFDTKATMNTNHRLVYFLIPEYSSDETGIAAFPTTNTLVLVKTDSTAIFQMKGPGGANPDTGRITACSTYNHCKSLFHPTCRSDTNTGLSESGFIMPS
jgi:hypothetical protein